MRGHERGEAHTAGQAAPGALDLAPALRRIFEKLEADEGERLFELAAVQRAEEKSALIRDLVDKNDIYHPLAWTAPDAYGFLNGIPLYEESGALVRVPDW